MTSAGGDLGGDLRYYRSQAAAIEYRLAVLSETEQEAVDMVARLERELRLWTQLADEIEQHQAHFASGEGDRTLF